MTPVLRCAGMIAVIAVVSVFVLQTVHLAPWAMFAIVLISVLLISAVLAYTARSLARRT